MRDGGLVVIPTETVYGLACLATSVEAVRKVYDAKGRPPENPLIVHVASAEQAGQVAVLDDRARLVMSAFWPGPLTLVLPKQAVIPSIVTAGLSTVAIRMPAHPVAIKLIELAGPLAAPSANRFMRLSPTTPGDVDPALGDFLVLDGGPCEVGIESTVLDLTGEPTLLRLGGTTQGDLERVLGVPVRVGSPSVDRRSPGQYPRHYCPTTPLRIAGELGEGDAGLSFQMPASPAQVQMPRDPSAYAALLYHQLASLDRRGLKEIVVQAPPETPEWAAVWDRLRRAAAPEA